MDAKCTAYIIWIVASMANYNWIIIDYCIDPTEAVKPVKRPESYSAIKLNVIIKHKKKAIKETKIDKSGRVLLTDGSK